MRQYLIRYINKRGLHRKYAMYIEDDRVTIWTRCGFMIYCEQTNPEKTCLCDKHKKCTNGHVIFSNTYWWSVYVYDGWDHVGLLKTGDIRQMYSCMDGLLIKKKL